MEDLPEKFSSTAEYIDTLVSYLEHWDGDTLGKFVVLDAPRPWDTCMSALIIGHILSLSYTDKAVSALNGSMIFERFSCSSA